MQCKEGLEKVWNVGQIVVLKDNADFSTIYVGSISYVYENRLVVIIVSETKPFLPRIVKIKNRIWESVIRDYEIKEEVVLVKPFPNKENILEVL